MPEKVTIVDVAKKAGVANSTVSHVINGTATITAATREKVLAAIRDLEYRPNASARALRQQRSKILGVTVRDIATEFYAKCIAGFLNEAIRENYAVMVVNADFDNQVLKKQVAALLERRVDGIAFIGGSDDGDILDMVADYKVPVVLGDRKLFQYPCVEFNNEETVCRLVEMLYASGYRKMAYIGEPLQIQQNLLERYNGFLKGTEKCGIGRENRLVILDETLVQNKMQGAYHIFERFFAEGAHLPEVIIADNDRVAAGIMAAARDHGITVPDHLGVVGYDDIEMSQFFNPSITTVVQDEAELGKQTFLVLKDAIDGVKRNVMISQEIRLRESVRIRQEVLEQYLRKDASA